MRVRVLKRVFLIAGIVLLVFSAVVAGIVIKQVYFPYYWNYSTDYVEAVYTVDNYEQHDYITPKTIIRVYRKAEEPPEVSEGAFVTDICRLEKDGSYYFIFENLDPKIKELELWSSKANQLSFSEDWQSKTIFSIYSKNWSKGCRVSNTKIIFKAVE